MTTSLIIKVEGLDHSVSLEQTGINAFTVRYGQHVRKNLRMTEAARELGECIFHSATCAGKVLETEPVNI